MAAEKIHSMEQADGTYFFGATTDLNSNLKLNLPTAASSEWAYSAAQSGSNCCVSAVRIGVGSDGRAWHVLSNDAENVFAGGCS
ncbi:MAG: hypothetical protein NTY47_00495 [Candidatus Omnitrophica bacterium]|nr:hypothetical protein [Candidatus Omnitrophota bacterium]